MRRALLFVAFVLAACEPDYSGTSFRCDAEHPECPSGQRCVNGQCTSGTGDLDAAIDTPDDSAPTSSTPGQTTCGGSLLCASDLQCCYIPAVSASCLAAGAACAGTSATCDESADCGAGERCCEMGGEVGCHSEADCEGESIKCYDGNDCPAEAPLCCNQPLSPFYECRLNGVGFICR